MTHAAARLEGVTKEFGATHTFNASRDNLWMCCAMP